MMCSFITDLVFVKVQCRERLCETKGMSDSMKTQGRYIVFLQSDGKMLSSFITYPIGVEVQCGEYLCETKRMRDLMKRQGCTLVCCRAVARWCAPSLPIPVELRFSVVNIYVKPKELEIL